jgi:hypothetical protein
MAYLAALVAYCVRSFCGFKNKGSTLWHEKDGAKAEVRAFH